MVEDDAAVRDLLVDVLSDARYDVRASEHGQAGLDTLRTWRPNAIVLDAVMPDVDAHVFRAVQSGMPRVADVPVLLTSATHAHDLDAIGEQLGAAAVLPKPFEIDRLLHLVARIAGR